MILEEGGRSPRGQPISNLRILPVVLAVPPCHGNAIDAWWDPAESAWSGDQ